MKLKAIRSLKYNTRRMEAGDEFEAPDKDARLLLATRKVTKMRDPVALAPPPPAVAKKIAAAIVPPPKPPSTGAITTSQMGSAPAAPPLPSAVVPSDLAAARAEYERVSGKKAFNGWDVATLQAKTAAAKTGQ